MKKFTRILSVILAAAMALTALCATASADDAENGYWKYAGTKTYIFRVGGEYVPEEKHETVSYRVDAEYEYWKTDVSGGKISMVYSHDKHESFYGNDLYGQYYSTTVTFNAPVQYYLKDADVNIKANVNIENNTPGNVGTNVSVFFTAEAPTEKNMGGYDIGGFTGELKTKDGKKADTSYSGYVGADPNSKFTCTGTYTAKFTAVNVKYGDIRNIVVDASGNRAVYTYKWTKGTPSEEGTGLLGITLKKGQSIQLWIDSSGKAAYSSSKKSVASVTSSGKVTAKAKGTVVITMKYGSKTQKVMIKVTA